MEIQYTIKRKGKGKHDDVDEQKISVIAFDADTVHVVWFNGSLRVMPLSVFNEAVDKGIYEFDYTCSG